METRKKPLPSFKHEGEGKKEFVQKMFNDISSRYDFLNHFLSLGMDIYWRKKFIQKLNIQSGQTILDVACGTGDIGLEILKKNNIELINLDFAKNMLDIAEIKAQDKRLKNIQFIQGDAEMLPLGNESIDCLTIAFGFRNIANHDKALEEFYRVLKPGCMLGILEFSIPKSKIFGSLFTFYFHHILPWIGSLFSLSDAYRYLPESVDYFPSRDDICGKIINAGFKSSTFIDVTFGVATIFLGQKSE